MPAHLPKDCQHETNDYDDDDKSPCDISIKRDDDTPEIVKERLETYHQHADPILDYVCNNRHDYRLLTLTPYHGFDDLPDLVDTLRRHVDMEKHI